MTEGGGRNHAPARPDPILDEIHRVREELIKKHGGFDGLMKHVK
jgi:hypothetical protein